MAEGPKNIDYKGPPEEKAYWLRSAQQFMKRIEDGIGGKLVAMGLRSWERVIHGKGADGSKKHATIRGSNFIGSMGSITNITIDVRGGKKELEPDEKLKKEIEEDIKLPWVIIIGIADPNTAECLGALILKPILANGTTDGREATDGFKVLKWIPRNTTTDTDRYAMFYQLMDIRGPFYGFKDIWYRESPGIKARYSLKECIRRSNAGALDYESDWDSTLDEGTWLPGPNLNEGANQFFSVQPVYGPDVGGIMHNENWYWVTYHNEILGAYWEKMGNTLYDHDCPYPNGAGVWDWAMGGTNDPYGSYGAHYLGASYYGYMFSLYWWRQGRWRTWGHFALPYGGEEGSEWVEDELHHGVFPYPADGIQRLAYIDSFYYDESWQFLDWNTNTRGPTIFEWDYTSGHEDNTWIEGVWTGYTESTYRDYQTGDEWWSYSGENCCTISAPDYSLPNDAFPGFSKWMAFVTRQPYVYDESYTVTPYTFSRYWDGPGELPAADLTFTEFYDYYLWIDDGAKITMAEHIDDDYYEDAWDCCICNIGDKPVYASHYAYPIAADTDKKHTVLAYWKGKLLVSEKFNGVHGTALDGPRGVCAMDVFDSFAKYGGYWNGQIRVGKLMVTTERTGTRKAVDGMLKEHRDVELREIPR